MDLFLAAVERRRDGQLMGVLYRNGVRVGVHEADGARNGRPGPSNDPLGGPTARATHEVPPAAVQHRRDKDPVAADQTRHADNDLLIHPHKTFEVGL